MPRKYNLKLFVFPYNFHGSLWFDFCLQNSRLKMGVIQKAAPEKKIKIARDDNLSKPTSELGAQRVPNIISHVIR